MILSRCHRSEVNHCDANEGIAWYECVVCQLPCDTMNLNQSTKDGANATTFPRLSVEIEQIDRTG